MSTSQPDPMIGRLIDGRYQVRSRIARGGMATVYLATDLRLERRVAIKVMHGHLADDSTFKSRFVQEARSAARLAHPNVVNVFDQGQDSDMAYLVMEYLPGITLRELLKDYGKLTPEQTTDIMEAVLSGLAAAHKAGIVHRDLKPENVLLADDGRIKIGDFGLARAASNNTASGQALLGTIAYLSPELVTRGVADARSDIYALGIMIFEMLTGEQPFQGEQPMQIAYQHANDSVPAPSTRNPAVPPELDQLVLWATAHAPEDRPRDAKAMLERLLEIERSGRGGADTPAGLGPTMVLPPAADLAYQTGDTQILGGALFPAAQVRPEASATDAVATLATTARRRRSRGWWVFALVLVLAAAAGGTGWYFGAGPGAQVVVPQVASQAQAAATTRLKQLDFAVKADQVYSMTVAAGLVVGTDPGAGVRAHKGSMVTLHVSQGRKPITIPALAGLSQADAERAITDAGALVGKSIDKQFNADVRKGTVTSAAKADGDKADLSKGGSYFQGLTVNLAVSLGPVPDVSGKSVADAQAALDAVGLNTQSGSQSYSDTVPSGAVIDGVPQNAGIVRPGDTILLNISRGPAPVDVPAVVGKTWADAKKALTDAGFKLSYAAIADGAPGLFIVQATNPAGGVSAPKGSTVTVTFANPFGG
ncbi:MAG: Stk1 family PASTA domain-containing Ser/Thr kinase [Microbacteriaceae bacterium]|nr:MAG: Stk1 family PASTA domain-containing Ser/Thr kinase [Microbacteriaceae bacterium]